MNQFENLKLDHQLCFALYAATHAVTRAYRDGLNQAGITYTQYLVMMVLWDSDGISVGSIAQKLQLDSATLTPMLKRLESAGFIIRNRNKEDERIVEISLTQTGNDLQEQIASVQHNVECSTGLTNDNLIQLRNALHKLTEEMSSSAK